VNNGGWVVAVNNYASANINGAARAEYLLVNGSWVRQMWYRPQFNGQGQLERMNRSGVGSVAYGYNGFGQLTDKAAEYTGTGGTVFSHRYDYSERATQGNQIQNRNQLVQDVFSVNGGSSTLTYRYYPNGNVRQVLRGGDLQQYYQYDQFNRLVYYWDAPTQTYYSYTYDAGGNISMMREYNTNGSLRRVVNYGYEQNGWRDLLTSFNGQQIQYDGAGNPTQWIRGMSNLQWQNGRQLASVNTNSSWGTVTMQYDFNGMRTRKVSEGPFGTTTNYFWQGNRLLAKEFFCTFAQGREMMWFHYDETGVSGMRSAGVDYYFRKNIFGDIIEIYNAAGTFRGRYEYDAWGNHRVIHSTLGDITDINNPMFYLMHKNPFRYRGYYFDHETGLYYLQSRYYDPHVGRFINADCPLVAAAMQGTVVGGMNLFSYAMNNPIMFSDPSGYFVIPILLGGIALTTIVCLASFFAPTIAGIVGGIIGYQIGSSNGAEGWELVAWTAGGVLGGFACYYLLGKIAMAGSAPAVILKGAMKGVIGRGIEGLVAYTIFGAHPGTWEDFAIAAVFGGIAEGSPQRIRALYDIAGRPLASQGLRIATGRQNGFQLERYGYDITTRAATYGQNDNPWRSIARGITRGAWHLYEQGIFGTQIYYYV
jgi:RHS repeat-associated protein